MEFVYVWSILAFTEIGTTYVAYDVPSSHTCAQMVERDRTPGRQYLYTYESKDRSCTWAQFRDRITLDPERGIVVAHRIR